MACPRRLEHLIDLAQCCLPQSRRGAFWRGFLLSLTFCAILILSLTYCGLWKFGTRSHDGYWQLATNLIRGQGYVFTPGAQPALHRPPLVPCLFSPLTLLPGPWQQPAVVLLHSLMVGATCGLLFELAQRLRGEKVARLSVGLLLCNPLAYVVAKGPVTFVTQMLLIVALLCLLVREVEYSARPTDGQPPWPWPARVVRLGLVCAAAFLTHGSMLLSVSLLLAGVLVVGIVRGQRRLCLVPLAAGGLALLLLAPWTWRNWVVTHHFVPVVTNAGVNYFAGLAHWEAGVAVPAAEDLLEGFRLGGIAQPSEELVSYWGLTDPELNALLDQNMMKHLRQHPGSFVRKVALNCLEFYFPITYDLAKPIDWTKADRRWPVVSHATVSLWNGVLWLLAVIGLWRTRHMPARLAFWTPLAAIVALTCPYFPLLTFIGLGLYTLPTLPLLMILVASAFVTAPPCLGPARRV